MPRNSYEINYARLEALMGRPLSDLEFDTVYRFRAAGFIDLVAELPIPAKAVTDSGAKRSAVDLRPDREILRLSMTGLRRYEWAFYAQFLVLSEGRAGERSRH